MYDTSVSKIHQRYGAMQKENKRCIPKEGMPHASACQKKEKIKDAYPKKVCHMLRHVKKKERKERIAPYPKRKKKRDGAYKRVHTPSTKKKYPHT